LEHLFEALSALKSYISARGKLRLFKSPSRGANLASLRLMAARQYNQAKTNSILVVANRRTIQEFSTLSHRRLLRAQAVTIQPFDPASAREVK
jgi:hypothetical protein